MVSWWFFCSLFYVWVMTKNIFPFLHWIIILYGFVCFVLISFFFSFFWPNKFKYWTSNQKYYTSILLNNLSGGYCLSEMEREDFWGRSSSKWEALLGIRPQSLSHWCFEQGTCAIFWLNNVLVALEFSFGLVWARLFSLFSGYLVVTRFSRPLRLVLGISYIWYVLYNVRLALRIQLQCEAHINGKLTMYSPTRQPLRVNYSYWSKQNVNYSV